MGSGLDQARPGHSLVLVETAPTGSQGGEIDGRGCLEWPLGPRCGRGGLVFLALARSAARRLGDPAARRLVGSPAQWWRPRDRSHVAACDRTTKPSWGPDAQAGLMRIPAFLPMEVSVKTPPPPQKKYGPRPGGWATGSARAGGRMPFGGLASTILLLQCNYAPRSLSLSLPPAQTQVNGTKLPSILHQPR